MQSFVDDMAVHSDQWEEHLIHLARFLKTMRDAKLTLNLRNVDGHRIELNSVEKFWDLVRDLQIQRRSSRSRNENTTDKDRIETNFGVLLIFS